MINLSGCGLGLRSDFLLDLEDIEFRPDFWEVTPENWMHMPKIFASAFEKALLETPAIAHGLSLSIGSPEKIDKKFVKDIKKFLDRYNIEYYSEHLSFSSLEGCQSYELLPLPMTKKMVSHVSDKIKAVEDIIQRDLILENATYYYLPYSEMREIDFINEVLEKSGAKMLLDVNNVFVNSVNHSFKARDFIKELDPSKIAYMHIAGHLDDKDSNMLIDTHGMPVCSGVWKLLEFTLKNIDAPVMIERDNNIPPIKVLIEEYLMMKSVCKEVKHG